MSNSAEIPYATAAPSTVYVNTTVFLMIMKTQHHYLGFQTMSYVRNRVWENEQC